MKNLLKICKEVLDDDYYLKFEDVKEDEIDEVPIKLKNNDLNASFEAVTEMYSLPKYNELDPTPLLVPFYLIFFGMMVADVGYGLLMLIGTFLALKFLHFDKKNEENVKIFHVFKFSNNLFGLMYGSLFGDIIKFKGLLIPTKDVMTILVCSVVFGVIQIFFGLRNKGIYVLIKAGKTNRCILWM